METPSLTLDKTVCCLIVFLVATINAQTISTTDTTVIKNSAPNITTGNNSFDMKILDSSRPFVAGSVVYEVISHDPESNHPITYKLENPVNDYVSVDEYLGHVLTTIDLRSADVSNVKLEIKVADSKGNWVLFTLVFIIKLNARPDIKYLPGVKSISENQAAGTTIITLEAVPDLHSDGIKLTWTLKPPAGRYKFHLDTNTGAFKLIEPLDFERTQRYTVTFVLSDGFLDSVGKELTIDVINVNEPPYFDKMAYHCTMDESDAGSSTCNIGATVRDPEVDRIDFIGFRDGGRHFRYDGTTSVITLSEYDVDVQSDKLTYHLVARDVFGNENKSGVPVHITVRDVNDNTCTFPKAGSSTCNIGATVRDPEVDRIDFIGFRDGGRHFRYDGTTSVITLSEYDVDVQSDKLTYHLVARDVFGNENKSGVPVHITVRDVNDNTCTFPKTQPVTLSQNDRPPKTVVSNFAQFDQDRSSPNKDVVYDAIQGVPEEANTYFAVATDGVVTYIEKIPEANNGKTYRLVVRCRDRGIPQRSAEGTILFIYQLSTTTSTTTTTTAAPPTTAAAATSTDPFDNPAFVAMFTVFMIALVIALLVGLYFLLRYCGSFQYCFGIRPQANKTRVMDISEYSNQSTVNYPPVRTNRAYTDDYWKNGDNYETGTGNALPSSSRAINGGFKRLALPAPAASRGFNF